jgi:hypothetical protein
MPNGQSSPFEFEDGTTRFSFEPVPQNGVRVRIASGDVGCAFDMSVVGAQRFSMMLSAALTRAINNR